MSVELTDRQRVAIGHLTERQKDDIAEMVLSLVESLVRPHQTPLARSEPESTGTGYIPSDVAQHVYRPSSPPAASRTR